MHLAHCLKASVTSPKWPFFPPNSGIWILLENPSFFFLLPPLEVEDLAEWELSELSPLQLPLFPWLLLPFLREEGSIGPVSEAASSSEVWGYGPLMGEGILPTEESVEWRDGERPDLGPPLLSFKWITGHLSWSRHRHSNPWLEGSHSNWEPRGLVQGGESFLKL